MGNSYQLLYNCPLAWRMASQPDYLGVQTQNKGINHAIRGPDVTAWVMVINNLIPEIKIKTPANREMTRLKQTNKQQQKYFSLSLTDQSYYNGAP